MYLWRRQGTRLVNSIIRADIFHKWPFCNEFTQYIEGMPFFKYNLELMWIFVLNIYSISVHDSNTVFVLLGLS